MAFQVFIIPIEADNSPLPVSVEEAKAHCNCDVDTWDAEFKDWIYAAIEALQVFTNRVFFQSTIIVKGRNEFDSEYIDLPYAVGASFDTGDVNGEVIAGKYYTQDKDIWVSYRASGESKAWVEQAIKMYVADLYANRGEQGSMMTTMGKIREVGSEAKQFCKGYINHGYLF